MSLNLEQIDRLNQLRVAAEKYAALESKPSSEKTDEERGWRAGVMEELLKCEPGEVVYFCGQVISNMKNHQSASMAMTVLGNRLIHR